MAEIKGMTLVATRSSLDPQDGGGARFVVIHRQSGKVLHSCSKRDMAVSVARRAARHHVALPEANYDVYETSQGE